MCLFLQTLFMETQLTLHNYSCPGGMYYKNLGVLGFFLPLSPRILVQKNTLNFIGC